MQCFAIKFFKICGDFCVKGLFYAFMKPFFYSGSDDLMASKLV